MQKNIEELGEIVLLWSSFTRTTEQPADEPACVAWYVGTTDLFFLIVFFVFFVFSFFLFLLLLLLLPPLPPSLPPFPSLLSPVFFSSSFFFFV